MKDYCEVCDEYTEHKKGKIHRIVQIGDITLEGDVYGYVCVKCGDDGIVTDSKEFDRQYAQTYRNYHNGMLSGMQIKAVREEKKMTIKKFVQFLHEHGINYSMDEYEDIENDTLVQDGKLEKFIRELGKLPAWDGYKK